MTRTFRILNFDDVDSIFDAKRVGDQQPPTRDRREQGELDGL